MYCARGPAWAHSPVRQLGIGRLREVPSNHDPSLSAFVSSLSIENGIVRLIGAERLHGGPGVPMGILSRHAPSRQNQCAGPPNAPPSSGKKKRPLRPPLRR